MARKNDVTIVDGNEKMNAQRDSHDYEHEIKSGDYWQHKETKEVRLIRSLDIIDGVLHSVNVLPHPSHSGSWNENGQWAHQGQEAIQFTLEEFLENFMWIDQVEAKKDREDDLDQLQLELKEASETLALGYVEEDGTVANDVLLSASSQIKTDMSLPVSMATGTTVSAIKGNIEKTKEIAEKQGEFIKNQTAVIAQKTSTLSRYYGEVAAQSLAAIDSTLVFVKKLNQGVHTLDIFMGEGVKVWQLAAGESAPATEKITMYQRKLFLDEEWFYNLAFGGADHKSLGAFRSALKDDFSLIDRIAPAQKSVVLMQFRREPKWRTSDFHKGSGDVWSDVQDAEADREVFLLVRNGKNVHFIFSDDLAGGVRLFPTSEEISELTRNGSGHFEGAEVDRHINFYDRENVRAREKMDKKTRYYQRILLMLNGVHTREPSVFGEVNDHRYKDWLSLDFQREAFHFVYDDEDALDWKSDGVWDLIERSNKHIQPGSRVIGYWSRIANEDNAKGMWSNPLHYDPQQIWEPIDTDEPLIVKADKDGLYVSVLCRHHWGDKDDSYRKLYLTRTGESDMLCVDRVKSKEINYLLNSRKHRPGYVMFAKLLIGARDLLQKEETMSRAFMEGFLDHLIGQYPQYSREEIEEAMYDTLSFWRVQHKGAALPSVPDEKVLKEVSRLFVQRFVDNRTPDVVAFGRNHFGARLLRVSGNGKRYFIYSEIAPEKRVYIGEPSKDYPFVQRHTLKIRAKGEISIERTQTVFYRESNIKEENYHIEKTLEIGSEDEIKDDDFLSRLEKLDRFVSRFDDTMSKLEEGDAEMMAMLDELITERIESFNKNLHKVKYIPEFNLSFPQGFYIIAPKKGETHSHYSSRKRLIVINAVASIDDIVARYGTDEMYERYKTWIAKTYNRAEERIIGMWNTRSEGGYIWKNISSEYVINVSNVPSPKEDKPLLHAPHAYCECKYNMFRDRRDKVDMSYFVEEAISEIGDGDSEVIYPVNVQI